MSDTGSQSEHGVSLSDLEMWFELSFEILESLSYSVQSEESLLFSGVIDHSLLLQIDDLTGRFESESFSQILKDLKAVNEQHISPGQHATQVAEKAYCLAAEAVQALLKIVHSKLVLISDRFASGAVRYHISGLSSIGLNEPFLEELRELFYQQVSSYRCREDLNRQQRIDSLGKDIDLITERLKAGEERGQVLKWVDADNVLPESVNRREEERAENESKSARLIRINQAANYATTFTETESCQDFFGEWAQRLVALGQFLKAENSARHLESIQSGKTDELQDDAFQYAVQIYQAAVSGDEEKVRVLLVNANHSEGARGEFCGMVNEALRRDIMSKLKEKEFSSPQNLTQGASNAQNTEEPHLISPDHSDLRNTDGYTIGQLIRDLTEYRNLRIESQKYTQKRAGQPALQGTISSLYAVQAAIFSKNAHDLFSRIPDDVIDQIRPLCEANGKFDVDTLKPLRAKLCLFLDETQSFVDAMSPSEFRRLTLMRIDQQHDGVDTFWNDQQGINNGHPESRETPTPTPKFNIPDGIDSDQSEPNPKGEGHKLEDRFEKAYQSYQLAEIRLEKCTDKEAYEWLTENGPDEYDLPPFETWQRYVRAGRKHYGANKNSPLAGRSGRSIVSPGG